MWLGQGGAGIVQPNQQHSGVVQGPMAVGLSQGSNPLGHWANSHWAGRDTCMGLQPGQLYAARETYCTPLTNK